MARTEMRSSKGKKLYAVRDSGGKFRDIQTFAKAHGMDMKRTAKDEKLSRILRAVDTYYTDGNRKSLIAKIKRVL